MKRAVGLGLALSLAVAGISVRAEEKVCLRSYSQSQQQLDLKLKQMEELSRTIAIAGVGSSGGLIMCAARARHWSAIAGCVVMFGAASWVASSRFLELQEQVHLLQGQARVLQIYTDFKNDRTVDAGLAEFFGDIGVDLQKERTILDILASGLESGELCSDGGKSPKTYEEVVSWLRNRG